MNLIVAVISSVYYKINRGEVFPDVDQVTLQYIIKDM